MHNEEVKIGELANAAVQQQAIREAQINNPFSMMGNLPTQAETGVQPQFQGQHQQWVESAKLKV